MAKKTRRKKDAKKRVFRNTYNPNILGANQKAKLRKRQPFFLKDTEGFANLISVVSKPSYTIYKDNHLRSKITYKEFGELIREYFKTAHTHIKENDAGVFIERLGYFGVFECPKKTLSKTFLRLGRKNHFVMFVPIRGDRSLSTFIIDKAFIAPKSIYYRLSKGKLYKNALPLLISFFGRSHNSIEKIRKKKK